MNTKDKYYTINSKWGDFESEYYTMLSAVDRMIELLEDKYGSLFKASKSLGFHPTYLTKQLSIFCACPRVMTIDKICKGLDISLNYAILGYGERQYTENTGSFKNFLSLYKDRYKGKHHMSLNVSICLINKGVIKSIPLKYLIRVAREQHVTIDWLIGG